MSAPSFKIEFPQDAIAQIRAASELLGSRSILAAVARGMDKAAALTVSDIQTRRLSGKGPFPVEEHRLGVVTNLLRASVRATAARVISDGGDSGTVALSIGSNVKYAALHEFGGDFTRTSKPGTARLATDRNGALIMRGKHGNLATFAKKKAKRARAVAYAGGKEYTVHYPARAPFGHGLADNAATFTREIARSIAAALIS